MESNYEIEFRNIVTPVVCPVCLRKFTTRLSVDYLSRHIGEEIKIVCILCSQSKIAEIKNSGRN